MGSGTQHPSRLRSGPGTGRALTAKCFECSAAIRQRWLRPRFPSSSAPRGRRQVNTASGSTSTGTSRFPSPTGPENGPPGQPLPSPARRRPPTRGVPAPPNSSRPPPPPHGRTGGTDGTRAAPAAPAHGPEDAATKRPPRAAARGGEQPGKDRSRRPVCASSPRPAPRRHRRAPSRRTGGGQDGSRASHREELRRSARPGAVSPLPTRGPARRGGTPGPPMLPAPRRHRLPLTWRRERPAARPRGGARPSRAGGEQQEKEERAEPGARPAHGPAATERCAATRPFQRAAPGEAAAAQVPPAPPRPDPAPHPPRISGSSARRRRAPPGASVRPREKRLGTPGATRGARFWHPHILLHGAAWGRCDRQDPARGRVGPHPVGLCPALPPRGGAPAAPCLSQPRAERAALAVKDRRKEGTEILTLSSATSFPGAPNEG